ncbi:MAG TPA: PfkB family carbohydrate kinase [Terracidiphilus sp.]|nr:PfkB family carbohydrate kinase [Terracidiphilus sp.]
MRILSVGEILWDVFGDREFIGGAPLNFSSSARRLGNSVALLSAVGADQRGTLALEAIRNQSLSTDLIQTSLRFETGTAIVAADAAGNASFAINRPAAFDGVEIDDFVSFKIRQARPDWIYFGTLAQSLTAGEQRLTRILADNHAAKRFYDINLREGHWDLSLVKRLSALATIIKMNDSEAEKLSVLAHGPSPFSVESFCAFWSANYGGETICVTLGAKGCLVWQEGIARFFEGFSVRVVDTVGAGDVFAAGFLHGLESGWSLQRTASFANALGAIVASRAGAIPNWKPEECLELMASRPEAGHESQKTVGDRTR